MQCNTEQRVAYIPFNYACSVYRLSSHNRKTSMGGLTSPCSPKRITL